MVDDGEGDGEGGSSGAVGGEDHLYQVIGTLKEEQSTKPTWVSDIIKVSDHFMMVCMESMALALICVVFR